MTNLLEIVLIDVQPKYNGGITARAQYRLDQTTDEMTVSSYDVTQYTVGVSD